MVDQRAEQARPGGAGLAALAAAACGAKVTLVTALGADAEGDLVRSLLDAAGVSLIDLGLAGPTPVKLRVRSGGQSLVRVDRGCSPVVPPGPWCDAAGEAVLCSHAVLASDYGRGLVAARPFADLVPTLAQPVVWDPHARGVRPPGGLDLLVPNRDEAARLDDAVAGDPEPRGVEDGDEILACRLARRFGCTVALTRGSARRRGGRSRRPGVRRPGRAHGRRPVRGGRPVRRRRGRGTGAGATMVEAVTAAATAAREHVAAPDDGAAGFRPRGAAPGVRWPAPVGVNPVTGSSASGPVTGPIPGGLPGPAPSSAGSPPAAVGDVRPAVAASGDGWDRPRDTLGLARSVRAAGGTVVVAGGCFDVLHPGHVRLLGAARGLGDCLIVCLNGDLSVRRLKGRRRPVNPVEDHAEVLRALAPVDAVLVFDEDDPCAALEQLRPHVFVKGADHAGADLPEREVLAKWGGEIVFVPVVPGRSTTRVLEIAAGTAAS